MAPFRNDGSAAVYDRLLEKRCAYLVDGFRCRWQVLRVLSCLGDCAKVEPGQTISFELPLFQLVHLHQDGGAALGAGSDRQGDGGDGGGNDRGWYHCDRSFLSGSKDGFLCRSGGRRHRAAQGLYGWCGPGGNAYRRGA